LIGARRNRDQFLRRSICGVTPSHPAIGPAAIPSPPEARRQPTCRRRRRRAATGRRKRELAAPAPLPKSKAHLQAAFDRAEHPYISAMTSSNASPFSTAMVQHLTGAPTFAGIVLRLFFGVAVVANVLIQTCVDGSIGPGRGCLFMGRHLTFSGAIFRVDRIRSAALRHLNSEPGLRCRPGIRHSVGKVAVRSECAGRNAGPGGQRCGQQVGTTRGKSRRSSANALNTSVWPET